VPIFNVAVVLSQGFLYPVKIFLVANQLKYANAREWDDPQYIGEIIK